MIWISVSLPVHTHTYTNMHVHTVVNSKKKKKGDVYRVTQFIKTRQQNKLFVLALQNTYHFAHFFNYTEIPISSARKSV